MNTQAVLRTPVISEQVLLLIAEKKQITREDIYKILGKTKEKKHAASTAIWRLKQQGKITIDNGVICFIGSVPEKKKIDRIWDALRQAPSLTVKELVCLTSASKRTVRNALLDYRKKGLVKVTSYTWEQTTDGLKRICHYSLIKKEIERPR